MELQLSFFLVPNRGCPINFSFNEEGLCYLPEFESTVKIFTGHAQYPMSLFLRGLRHSVSQLPRDFYELAIADNGIGIAPECHQKIGGIFQRLEARDKVEGTGIGLSVVKKIVEGRSGRVWIKSELGVGATFYFTWHKQATVCIKS